MIEYQKESESNNVEEILEHYSYVLESYKNNTHFLVKNGWIIPTVTYLIVFLSLTLFNNYKAPDLVIAFLISGAISMLPIMFLDKFFGEQFRNQIKKSDGSFIYFNEEMDKLHLKFNNKNNCKEVLKDIDECIEDMATYNGLFSDKIDKLHLLKKEFILIHKNGSNEQLFHIFIDIYQNIWEIADELDDIDSSDIFSLPNTESRIKQYL